MPVPDDLLIYLRNLRAGAPFDQQVFEVYIDQLNTIAVDPGLNNDELISILNIWLSMKISVKKWICVGVCLIPAQKVSNEVIQLAGRWILTHYDEQQVSRVSFVLNWLAGLIDHDLADSEGLDDFYEIFYHLFRIEKYAPFSLKLVYNLTKSEDVTRWRVLELLKLLCFRRSGKRRAEVNVLLGLFKSYKPEAVPEYIPALSVHNVFAKVHTTLLSRFQMAQERISSVDIMGREKLCWSVFRKFAKSGSSKNYVPLVPDVEFITAGSNLYLGVATQKTCLRFKQIAPLLECGLRGSLQRPSNVLSMLTNPTGAILLAIAPAEHHSQLCYNVHHLLCMRVLRQDRTHTNDMQADLLQRLADFQNIIQQPVPVVSMFLAKYLPFWNGYEFFEEIMSLIQWVSFDTFAELKENILDHLEEIYTTIRPWTRCLIQHALLRLYSNLAFSLRKGTFVFLKSSRPENLRDTLAQLATFIDGLCTKTLQVYPNNAVAHLSMTWLYQQLSAVDKRTRSTWSVLPPTLATVSLASPSAYALDALAGIVLQYRDIYTVVRQEIGKTSIRVQMDLTERYKEDFINALWSDEPIQGRASGVVFQNLSDNAITDIFNRLSQADMALGISSHLALAPYTYLSFLAVDNELMDRVAWLDNAVMPNFKHIAAIVHAIDASLS